MEYKQTFLVYLIIILMMYQEKSRGEISLLFLSCHCIKENFFCN